MINSSDDARRLPISSWVSADRTLEQIQEDVSRLYETRGIVVFRSVLSIIRDTYEAEDITQDAFLRLYSALRSGESIRNTVEWLVVVAKNLARDRLKRMKRQTSITDVLTAKAKNPEEVLIDESYYQMWLRMRDRLPPTEQACLELFGRGATFKEISISLGLPYRDAIHRTKQAIEKFRRFKAEGGR